MLSSRPYIARGLYEWLLDNEQTPYIVVDAEQAGVRVPRQFVQNGQIVLNVGPTAVRDLHIENDAITFHARFGGQPMQVVVPMPALVALYARENGVGMVFGHEPVMPAPAAQEPEEEVSSERPGLASVERDSAEDAPGEEGEAGDEAPPTKGRPSLRVIK
ncbi:ClpXP protease specificity-enhancing factor [Halomonas campisalis]|uniref:ClpXP protease specificity-enhancing factor n=1 Tax=Billgrantia campisalis TaxID=74661 RepID=A0ABS9P4B2_9GAMM|nr:ClpXP protease specificity-enhancing factor [Halomonas campisalis]MCG6656441.1 ClpXP protease specificity-enhancing factor [Halomonas campisalis]MDR5861627.1 ClpXP protease specificity-enhancing factor [Halomonas campisalis]